MNDNNKQVENDFIDEKISQSEEVKIFLVNGVKLSGSILKHDEKTLLMTSKEPRNQLVYKRNINTIL